MVSVRSDKRSNRLQRNTLTRELIARAALEVLDQGETEGLTFARLGRKLGSSPTAVYRHFPGRRQILVAVVEELVRETIEGYTPSEEWSDSLLDIAVRTWNMGVRHPEAVAATGLMYSGGINELKVVDAILAALLEGGLSGRSAVAQYQAFAHLVLGMTTMNAARQVADKADGETGVWVQIYPAVDPSQFPAATGLARELSHVDLDEIYLTTVRQYLDGLSRALEEKHHDYRTEPRRVPQITD